MIIDLKSEKLEVGMYIILSDTLFDNPFWKSHFVIKNQSQIQKILKAQIKQVKVDTEKCAKNIEIKQTVSVISPLNKPVEDKKATAQPESAEVSTPQAETKPVAAPVIEVKGHPAHEKEPATPPDKWEPNKFMPPQLVEAFKDKNLPVSERSKVVHDYSREMMKNILESPTPENIAATKDGVAEIVDIIMNENETCESLTKIVSHDFYTYTHSVNVGIKSVLLAKEFYGDSSTHDMHELGAGFFLHDIGKVNISTEIINKRGRLSESEMDEMRRHPDESKKILTNTNHLNKEFEVIVMQHHERDDGTGYPLGLKGFEIHPYASICCLADVYDALTGKRSYKVAKTPAEALEIMTKQMSNHFNRDMLNKFIAIFERSGELTKVNAAR